MSTPAISTDAIFTSLRTRVDRSLGFTGVTPELDDTAMLAFFKIKQINVKLLIQPMDTAPANLVEVKSEFDYKRPSQRLRAALFVLHSQLTIDGKLHSSTNFEAFYLDQMNRMIQSVKDQLKPE